METFRGIAASPGVAIGPAFVVDRWRLTTPQYHVGPHAAADEIERLRAAVRGADAQYDRLKARLQVLDGEVHYGILEAHQLMLHDERMLGNTERKILQDGLNAEWALRRTADEIKALFDDIDDPYFRERRNDIDFVAERLLRNLLGQADQPSLPPGTVMVARDLSPADAALLRRSGCVAFATDVGGFASHTSIIARSFELPAVVGLERFVDRIGQGDLLIVDGTAGEVLVNPPPEVVAEYENRRQRETAADRALLADRRLAPKMLDGHRVTLSANIELPEEAASAVEHGAEGIGLFRTEFLYMNRGDVPTEEEHYREAAAALKRLRGRPITFRTFDIGADKLASLTAATPVLEPNPALGLRSIRLSLRNRPLFLTQLRGLVRAAAGGPVRILFPMIASMEELRAAKAVLQEARASLEKENVAVGETPLGVMIETPSAAIMADRIVAECDFLSVGTNDLIQYTLAVDRASEHVHHLYDPLQPSILRLIRSLVDVAHAAGKRVNVCGEMASDPKLALLLIGLGVDELSMNVGSIPRVKQLVRASRWSDARAVAQAAVEADTADDVRKIIQRGK